MSKILCALWVLALFVVLTHWMGEHKEALEPTLFQYVADNFEADCGTTNAISAILLNYRMYDTMFEVLILLTAIVGMKQFLPAPGEFRPRHPARSPKGPS